MLLIVFNILFAVLLSVMSITDFQINIKDKVSGAPVAGATVVIVNTNSQYQTNLYGTAVIPADRYESLEITIRAIGYKTITIVISTEDLKGSEYFVELETTTVQIGEIIIISSPTGSGYRYQPAKAYNAAALKERSDITMGQMLDGEPGVAMRSLGPIPARPVIRGLDGERILILENGERMGDISESAADHAVALDPQATDRLEVIRGPASLLFGSNALGGVINMVTSDIPQDWSRGTSGSMSLLGSTVNSFGSVFTRMGYGLDNSAVNARLSFRNAGNTQTPGGTIYSSDMTNWEGSIGYGFKYGNLSGGSSLMYLNSYYGIPDLDEDADERVEIRFDRIANQGRFDIVNEGKFLDKYLIKYHLSKYDQKEVVIDNQTGSPEVIGLSYLQKAYSTTITAQHKPWGVFDRGVIGININGRTMDVGGTESYTPGDQVFNIAAFVYQELPVSDIFRLQGGLRYDLRSIQTRKNEAYPNIDESKINSNLASSIGMNIQPSSRTEIGVQIARAHRYPTSEELFANGVHLGAGTFEVGNVALKPENSYGFDTFIKYSTLTYSFEVTGFYNYITNFIVFQPIGTFDSIYNFPVFQYQRQNARLFGTEFLASRVISTNWSTQLGMDYVNGTRLDDDRSPLPFMPPLRLKLNLDYGNGPHKAGISYRKVFTQNRVAPEEESTEGYSLMSFNYGYRLDRESVHQFIVRVDNLLNVSYRDHLSRLEGRGYLMPGRNISLIYSVTF